MTGEVGVYAHAYVCVRGGGLNHPGVRWRARLRVFNRQVSP